MLPFSKRPPPPDEYLLRSGDLEAVRQDPYSSRSQPSYAPPSYAPPAQHSPPPAFVRQAAQTPYGFTQQQYGHRNDLSAPPPPHSLAPMAMSADSSGRYHSTTGVSHMGGPAQARDSRPSVKWGVMIALSGALLGGVLGLGMDAHRQQARAAAAADAAASAPPAAVAVAPVAPVAPVAQPVAAVAPAPVVLAPPAPAPVVLAPPAPAAPVVLAAAPPVVVAKPAPHARPAARPHGFLAAKVTPPARPAPEKADAPEPKATAKADAPKPAAKKDPSTSDAMKILEAANKDTTNTL